MSDFIVTINPYLSDLAVAAIIALLGMLTALSTKGFQYLSEKIGAARFNGARELAKGVWLVIQKAHPEWDPTAKIAEMELQLLSKYPHLTQVQLDAINKEVHKLMNSMYGTTTPTEEVQPTPAEG